MVSIHTAAAVRTFISIILKIFIISNPKYAAPDQSLPELNSTALTKKLIQKKT